MSIFLRCFPFQIGDRVMAFVNYNAWAEVVCAPMDFVYKMPDRMSFAEAAAFSLNFVAAYMMLFEVANLREGMSVLVHSAGGGVVSAVFLSILLHVCFCKCDHFFCFFSPVNIVFENSNITLIVHKKESFY